MSKYRHQAKSEATQRLEELAEQTIPSYNESTGEGYHRGHVLRKVVKEFPVSPQSVKKYLKEMFIEPGVLVEKNKLLYDSRYYEANKDEIEGGNDAE